jgi:hypothetical protein
MAAKENQKNRQQGKKNIGNEGGGLDLVPVIDVLRFTEKFDHWIPEQTLFNRLYQSDNAQKQRPYTHFIGCRKYFFSQDNITDYAKSDKGKPVEQGKKNRMNPE